MSSRKICGGAFGVGGLFVVLTAAGCGGGGVTNEDAAVHADGRDAAPADADAGHDVAADGLDDAGAADGALDGSRDEGDASDASLDGASDATEVKGVDAPGAADGATDGGAWVSCGRYGWGDKTIGELAPDGATFAVASSGRLEVRTWSGTLRPISVADSGASALAFSGDGQLFVASTRGAALVWRLSDDQVIDRIPQLAAPAASAEGVDGLSVSRDGSVIVGNGSVVVRRPGGVTTIAPSAGDPTKYSRSIDAFAVSPDGTLLVRLYADYYPASATVHTPQYTFSVEGVRLSDGAQLWMTPLPASIALSARRTRIAFSPDGTKLAVGAPTDSAGTVGALFTSAGTIVGSLSDASVPVRFSDDGARIVGYGVGAGGAGRTAVLWRASDGFALRTLASAGGSLLVSGLGAGTAPNEPIKAVAYDPVAQQVQLTAEGVGAASLDLPKQALSAALTHDGLVVGVAGSGEVSFHDVASGAVLMSWPGRGQLAGSAAWAADGRSLALSPDEARFVASRAVVGVSHAIVVTPGVGEVDHGAVASSAFSPDGAVFATGMPDGTVQLWPLGAAGAPVTIGVQEPTNGGYGIVGLAFSGDGTKLVTLAASGTLTAWDAHAGTSIVTRAGLAQTTDPLVLSDGKRVLVNASGSMWLWDPDASTFAPLPALSGLTVSRGAVVSTPGPVLVAWAVANDTLKRAIVRVDLANAQLLAPLDLPPEAVEREAGLAASRDARVLALSTADGVTRLWCAP